MTLAQLMALAEDAAGPQPEEELAGVADFAPPGYMRFQGGG